MSNSIKFTPAGGKVTVLLKILSIEDFGVDSQVASLAEPAEEAKIFLSEQVNSAPDKTYIDSSEEHLAAQLLP